MTSGAVNTKIVSFPTADDITLDGLLQLPNHPGPVAVIHVHGMGGNFYSSRALKIGENLARHGIPFFSINTRGHDLSAWFARKDGSHGPMVGTIRERFEDSLFDIEAALEVIRDEYGNKTKVVLSGHSTGCQKITYYALQHGVSGLVLLAPGDDYKMITWELGPVFERTYKKAARLEAAGRQDEILPEVSPGLSAQRFLSLTDPSRIEGMLFNYKKGLPYLSHLNTPVLAVLGTNDPSTAPADEAFNLLRRQIGHQFEGVILDADHSLAGHETMISRLIKKFIDNITRGYKAPE